MHISCIAILTASTLALPQALAQSSSPPAPSTPPAASALARSYTEPLRSLTLPSLETLSAAANLAAQALAAQTLTVPPPTALPDTRACFTLRTYTFKRPDGPSDTPRRSGYSTCVPLSEAHARDAHAPDAYGRAHARIVR